MSTPTNVHYSHLFHVLQYIRGTIDWCLFFSSSSSLQLHAYFDATWGSNPSDLSLSLLIVSTLVPPWLPKRPRSRLLFPTLALRLSCVLWPVWLLRWLGYGGSWLILVLLSPPLHLCTVTVLVLSVLLRTQWSMSSLNTLECIASIFGPLYRIRLLIFSIVGTLRTGYLTYKPQVKISCRACIHTLPCALRLRTSPPSWGGLRCCHVSYSSRPRLLTEVGSDPATCPMAPDIASQLRWAPVLPRVLWLQTSPLS
jgi:hypothetical protein